MAQAAGNDLSYCHSPMAEPPTGTHTYPHNSNHHHLLIENRDQRLSPSPTCSQHAVQTHVGGLRSPPINRTLKHAQQSFRCFLCVLWERTPRASYLPISLLWSLALLDEGYAMRLRYGCECTQGGGIDCLNDFVLDQLSRFHYGMPGMCETSDPRVN